MQVITVKTEDTVCPNFSQKKRCSPKLSYTTQHSLFCYWYQKSIVWKSKTKKTPLVYKTDKIANLHGHEVIRTPVRHCELNPIELIWAQVKGFVAKNNTTFRLKDPKELTYAAFGKMTKNVWTKAEEYVVKIEKEYCKENCIDRSVI